MKKFNGELAPNGGQDLTGSQKPSVSLHHTPKVALKLLLSQTSRHYFFKSRSHLHCTSFTDAISCMAKRKKEGRCQREIEGIEHKMVRINGIKMHIVEKGEGLVVLFLHGFPELWYSWCHPIVASSPLATMQWHLISMALATQIARIQSAATAPSTHGSTCITYG